MHQLVGAGDRNFLLGENAAAFFPVGQDHLDILVFLLVDTGGFSAEMAVNGGAGFVCHAGTHIERTGEGVGGERFKSQPGLFKGFPLGGFRQ